MRKPSKQMVDSPAESKSPIRPSMVGSSLIWGFPEWGYLQIIHFKRIFHKKPSILGYFNLWKPTYSCCPIFKAGQCTAEELLLFRLLNGLGHLCLIQLFCFLPRVSMGATGDQRAIHFERRDVFCGWASHGNIMGKPSILRFRCIGFVGTLCGNSTMGV